MRRDERDSVLAELIGGGEFQPTCPNATARTCRSALCVSVHLTPSADANSRPFHAAPTKVPSPAVATCGAFSFASRSHFSPSAEVYVAPAPIATKRPPAKTTLLRCSPSSPVWRAVHVNPSAL